MRLIEFILITTSLVPPALSIQIPNREPLQQPIASPHDNINLGPLRDALISNKVIGDVLDDFEPTYYLDVVYPHSDVRVALGNEIDIEAVKERPILSITHITKDKEPPKAFLDESANFTVVLTDPDAKSRYRPKWSEMCHWIITNVTTPSSPDGRTVVLNFGLGFGSTDELTEIQQAKHLLSSRSSSTTLKKHKKHKKDKKKKKHSKGRPRPNECKKDKKGGKCLPGELKPYFAPGPPARTGWHRYVFVLLQGNTTSLTAPSKRKHWGYGLPRHGVRQWASENGLEVVGANFFFAENAKQFLD